MPPKKTTGSKLQKGKSGAKKQQRTTAASEAAETRRLQTELAAVTGNSSSAPSNNNEIDDDERALLYGNDFDDEAVEDNTIVDDEPAPDPEDEEDGEDLFGDTYEADYRAIPGQDEYDAEGLDDQQQYGDLTADQRASAEAAIRRRRLEAAQRDGRLPAALLALDDDLDTGAGAGLDGADEFDDPSLMMMMGVHDHIAGQPIASARGSRLEAAMLDAIRQRTSKRRRESRTDDSDDEINDMSDPSNRQQHETAPDDYDDIEDVDADTGDGTGRVSLEDFRGELKEWIVMDAPRREIGRQFREFLSTFVDPLTGTNVYEERIHAMCAANRESLEVSYPHLVQAKYLLALWIVDEPIEMLRIFDEVAHRVVLSKYPHYDSIIVVGGGSDSAAAADRSRNGAGPRRTIHVRISDLPICERLRDIRQIHLNTLIKVSGVVTRRTAVYPQLTLVKFDCGSCHAVIGPIAVNSAAAVSATVSNSSAAAGAGAGGSSGSSGSGADAAAPRSGGGGGGGGIPRPAVCPQCLSRGPFHVNNAQTVYRNYQKVKLQESPGSVPAGRIPRSRDVVLVDDLVDSARPGEEIEVTGVYRNSYDAALNTRNGFPVFATLLEANHVCKRADRMSAFQLTEDDRRRIRQLARDPGIAQRIVRSLAPSIYGHEDIKMALALALFGGQAKDIGNGKHRIRGDINVLLLGDPGTAKSQFLKYVEQLAHRAVYTTGKGSTAVGLTAAVHKDPVTREWTLEGGALVLADNGVCMIDEFDKMGDQDRTSIHEAMEQQSISISKAGIVTTLQARCSVIAAANPIRGRYDTSLTFQQNVELTDPILSRFDILCVVRDSVDPIADEQLANFVVGSHMRSHPRARALRDAARRARIERSAANRALRAETQPANDDEEPIDNNDDDDDEQDDEDEAEKPPRKKTKQTTNGNQQQNNNNNNDDDDYLNYDNEENIDGGDIADDGLDPQRQQRQRQRYIPQDLLKKYIVYAKQNCHPRLVNLDIDKVARFYAELRRESTVGGGIPVSVRHIESITRMAEAHARMHLRDHVRDDDVNAAISVFLDSFIATQKYSVARALRRAFARYHHGSRSRDHTRLLLHILAALVRDQAHYDLSLAGIRSDAQSTGGERVEVDVEEFEARARELEIYNVRPFLESDDFRKAGFRFDPAARVIVKSFTGGSAAAANGGAALSS